MSRLHSHAAAWSICLALIPAFVRNALEALGRLGGGQAQPIDLNYASLGNTALYLWLILIGGGTVLHWLLRSSDENAACSQLRWLLLAGLAGFAAIFVLVPVLNYPFNYHGLRLPLTFAGQWPLMHLFLPVGAAVGFVCIFILYGGWILPRIYPERTARRRWLALGLSFAALFGWTYQVGGWLAWHSPLGELSWLRPYLIVISYPVLPEHFTLEAPPGVNPYFAWPHQIHAINVYSVTLIFGLLLLGYPFWRYYSPRGGERYLLLGWLVLLVVAAPFLMVLI